MKDTENKETNQTGGNLKENLVIVNSTYYDIEGNIVRYGHMVGVTGVDSATQFEYKLFSDYKEARQFVREKYGI